MFVPFKRATLRGYTAPGEPLNGQIRGPASQVYGDRPPPELALHRVSCSPGSSAERSTDGRSEISRQTSGAPDERHRGAAGGGDDAVRGDPGAPRLDGRRERKADASPPRAPAICRSGRRGDRA